MRYNADHKSRVRRRLLIEAAASFWKEGPESVGIGQLMAKVGLTHGAFYAHFKSKDEFVLHSIDEVFQQSYDKFIEVTDGKSPRQALIAYVDFCLSNCHTFSPTSGCAIPSVAIHVSRVGQSARIQFSEGTHRIQCAIATLITRLGRDKDQSTEIAVSLLCEMVGAVSIARAMGPSLHSAKILKRARISIQRKLG